MLTPELLSLAGSLKNMRYAYGADAVYAGQSSYSLQVRNNEFNHQNLALGIAQAHQLGKKFYVVVNIALHNAKLKTFLRDLQSVIAMEPDTLIMSDPGHPCAHQNNSSRRRSTFPWPKIVSMLNKCRLRKRSTIRFQQGNSLNGSTGAKSAGVTPDPQRQKRRQ